MPREETIGRCGAGIRVKVSPCPTPPISHILVLTFTRSGEDVSRGIDVVLLARSFGLTAHVVDPNVGAAQEIGLPLRTQCVGACKIDNVLQRQDAAENDVPIAGRCRQVFLGPLLYLTFVGRPEGFIGGDRSGAQIGARMLLSIGSFQGAQSLCVVARRSW